MVKTNTYRVEESDHGTRVDVFLAAKEQLGRNKVQALIKAGAVTIDSKTITKSSIAIRTDQQVQITEMVIKKQPTGSNGEKKETIAPKDIPVAIIAETDNYLVINKPSGFLVHPTQAEEPDTIKDWLLVHYPKVQGVGESDVRPGIVHRLDKDTSGIMVIAKTQAMFDHLKNQFKNRTVQKEYTVLVHGVMEKEHGIIDFAIDRGKDGRMVSRPKTDPLSLKTVNNVMPGKEALTEFFVEKQYVNYALLRIKIHTGRTHQIRVHMYAYDHPVVGDKLYVNRKILHKRDTALGRIFLHAKTLGFTDLNGKDIVHEAPIPDTLTQFANKLT